MTKSMAPEVKMPKGRTPEKGTKEALYPPTALMHHPKATMGYVIGPRAGGKVKKGR